MSNKAILIVEDLKKYFTNTSGLLKKKVTTIKAVDGVSLKVNKGETLGIVGESGCGKSTMGRAILRLIDKTEGIVKFQDVDIHSLTAEELRVLRPKMQMIFQDPYSSLNPKLTVEKIIGEALIEHNLIDKHMLKDKVLETMELCGLAEYHAKRYANEFSGGQRQRIGIARSLALDPSFIIADEPVSALDVSIQSQIINLLMEHQEKKGVAYLFISHDLSVVKHISHRVGVMYLGNIVESALKHDLYSNALHPYTKALLSAVPIPNPNIKCNRIVLSGDLPSPSNPPAGCKFHKRCPYSMKICESVVPTYKEVEKEHFVACHLY